MRLAGRRVPLAPKSGPVRGRGAACEPLKTPTPTEITHGVRNTTSFLYGLALARRNGRRARSSRLASSQFALKSIYSRNGYSGRRLPFGPRTHRS
jgi:hypothetical protein